MDVTKETTKQTITQMEFLRNVAGYTLKKSNCKYKHQKQMKYI